MVSAVLVAESGLVRVADAEEVGTIPIPPILSPATDKSPQRVAGDYSIPTKREFQGTPADPSKKPSPPRSDSVLKGYVEGVSQELPGQRQPNAKIYRNPDGTKTARVYSGPIHFQDETGTWKEFDTRVLPDPTGYHNAAGPVVVHFAQTANAEDLVTVKSGEFELSFGLEGASLSPGVPEGSTIKYPAAAGADLEYRLGKTTLKETLTLIQPPSGTGPVRFRFPMKVTGLTPRQEDGGAIGFFDATGEKQFGIPPATMWDSDVDPKSSEPKYGPASVSLVQEADKWVIVLEGDGEWLRDPSRKYPVYLDPTLYFGVARYAGGFDSFVTDAFPNNNYNVSWDSSLGRYQDKVGYFDGSTGTNWSYLYYDVNFLWWKTILYGEWNGYWIWSYYPSTWTHYQLQPIATGWDPNGITWNNKPGLMANTSDADAVRNVWTQNDITGWVHAWTHNIWGMNGVAVHASGQGTGSWKKLAANENNDWSASHIRVDYNTPPGMASASSPANGGSLHDVTPQLSVSASDADGDSLSYWYYVCEDQAMTSNCRQSGWQSSTFTVPVDWNLDWNRTYYWKADTTDGIDVATANWVWSFRTTNAAPNTPTASSPTANSIVNTTTPVFTASGNVSDPDGDTVKYAFRISSGPDGNGSVVESGGVSSTTWTPDLGSLKDGASYYWSVASRDAPPDTPNSWAQSAWSPSVPFKVDLGLGDRPSRPYDRMGPVAVNLSNGNLLTTTSSPSFTSVGGSIGVSYSYNSQLPSNQGLSGFYFNDDGNKIFDSYESPSLNRSDSQIVFNWLENEPYGSVRKDNFNVRWVGYLTVPATGTYKFGTRADDGTKVWVNNSLVFDNWVDQPMPASPGFQNSIALSAGQTVPIKVEYYENGGAAAVELWADGPFGPSNSQKQAHVPASWLTRDLPGLPDGWALSADVDGDLGYTFAQISDGSVSVIDSTGATHAFKWNGTGWIPPAGEDSILGYDASGLLVLHTEDGRVYNFDSGGTLTKVSSPLDDRTPAAPVYEWNPASATTGAPARLTKITDPVSGKFITLTYGGDPSCPSEAGFTAAPNYMLCKIDYSDFAGSVTNLFYSNGHLARITDPGSEVTDFGYDSAGRLTQIRDSLTNDLIAANAFSDPTSDTHKTVVEYTSGKATRVTSPVPDGGGSTPSPQHSYDYLATTSKVHIAGIPENPSRLYVREVTMDSGGRLIEDRDLAGKVTKYEWDFGDRLKKKTDPTNIVSTTIYDVAGRPTDNYGPGAASEFGSGYTSATAPRSQTFYDENILGLGAAWWDQAGLAGSPKAHTTLGAWTNWGTASPASNIPTDGFSGRLTGEVNVTTPGTYAFSADVAADDGVRVFVDDSAVINRWTTYQRTLLQDQPKGYWRLGTAVSGFAPDYSGNSRHGQYLNGAVYGSSGALSDDADGSVALDGVNDYVEVAHHSSLSLAQFSVEAWVYPQAVKTNWQPLVVKEWSDGYHRNYGMFIVPNSMKVNYGFQKSDCTNWAGGDSSSSLTKDVWNHIVMTYDGTKVSFYLNGALDASQSVTTTPCLNSEPVRIGWDQAFYAFQGKIDEAAIFDKALSGSRIGTHYDAGRARLRFDPYKTAVLADTPKVYYQLAESSGLLATNDATTGATYNGSYVNSPSLAQPGKITGSGATVFDGVNDYVRTPNVQGLFADETVTIETWVRADAPGVVVAELGGTATPDTLPWHDSQIEIAPGGEVRVRVWDLQYVELGKVGFGAWHHIVLRYNKANQVLDGFLDGVRSFSETSGDRTAPWEAGYSIFYALGGTDSTNLGSGAWFKGAIDEFVLFNAALTDQQIQEHYRSGAPRFCQTADPSSCAGGTTELTAGAHRIRIDYQDPGGDAKLFLNWTPPGGSSVQIPTANLKPRYGLTTTTIDPDGKKTRTVYETPELGLPTETIVDPDTGGLQLRSTVSYEPLGSGFLRRTSRTLPRGSTSTISYSYFGATDTADNPCTGPVESISQRGMLKTATSADPDGVGSQQPIVREFRYDLAGRTLATRVIGDANWSCMSYDSRGRVTSRADSTGKTTTHSYATPGVVTTSFPDSAGTNRTTTSRTDWLGRSLSYTDEHGTTTRSVYDQAGRVIDTYRQFSAQSDSRITHLDYDATSGRLSAITEYASGSGRTTNFTYDDSGRLLATTRPNGVVTTNTFSPSRGWLDSISHKKGTNELSPWSYGRFASGDVQTETTTGRTRTFVYDNAGRLTTTTEGSTTRRYCHDANSNRTSVVGGSCGAATYSYDNADRLLSSPFATGYTYDSHGNLTSANPITQPPSGSLNESFSFDAAVSTAARDYPVVVGQNGTLSTTLDWTPVTYRTGNPSGSINAAGTVSSSVSVAGSSTFNGSLSWTQGSKSQSSNTSSTVAAGGTNSHAISPSATGNISASLDWNSTTKSYSYAGNVDITAPQSYPIQVGANGTISASLTWPTSSFDNLDLELYDPFGTRVALSNNFLSNSESISYTVGGISYPSTATFTLKVVDVAGIGTPFTLSGSYPVTADLDLELWNPSSVKVASSYSTTAKPETISYANAPSGSYTLKVISKNHSASYTLSSTYQSAAFADLTLRLKNPSGTTLTSARSATGSLSLSTVTPGGGNHTFEITNNSSDINVPSYSGSWSLNSTMTLALKDSTGAVIQQDTSGAKPKSISRSLTAGRYTISATPTGGVGTATLTASYPGRPAKEVIKYDGNEHAIEIDDGTNTVQETLAPSGRVLRRVVSDSATGDTVEDVIFGYDGDGDSPAYSRPTSGGATTTYIGGPNGLAVIDTGGTPTYPISNGHGDIVGNTDSGGAFTANPTTDEFGVGSSPSTRLGWLGERERFSTGGNLGLIRMGVRLYDPNLGRFLQVDPVEGGSATSYDYCFSDPINCFDLDGREAAQAALLLGGGGVGIGAAVTGCIASVVCGVAVAVVAVGIGGFLVYKWAKGRGRQRDTGLQNVSDAEVSRRAHDPSLSAQERLRYQKEEKARVLRNVRKRGRQPRPSPSSSPTK